MELEDFFVLQNSAYGDVFDPERFEADDSSPLYLKMYSNAIPETLRIPVGHASTAEAILNKYQEHLLTTENAYFEQNMSDRTKRVDEIIRKIMSRFAWSRGRPEDDGAGEWGALLRMIRNDGMQQRYVRHLVLDLFGHGGRFWTMMESPQVKRMRWSTRKLIAAFLGYILGVYIHPNRSQQLVFVYSRLDLVNHLTTADPFVDEIVTKIVDTLLAENPE
tara:strand:+ start:699 stop:1355 length:657 start_codon:yes stop_codon:yes gene_type:complete